MKELSPEVKLLQPPAIVDLKPQPQLLDPPPIDVNWLNALIKLQYPPDIVLLEVVKHIMLH
jgi:hypothetical protein